MRGSYCDICNAKEIIYAFDKTNTVRCGRCHALLHKRCFNPPNPDRCPTCIRTSKLKQQQQQQQQQKQTAQKYQRK